MSFYFDLNKLKKAELIKLARAGIELRALVANDAYAITFQHSGRYRTALLKAFDAAMEKES